MDDSRVDRRDGEGHRCNQAGAGLGADEGQGFDERCTPALGALPNGPHTGEWFQAHFEQLLSNAWPPL